MRFVIKHEIKGRLRVHILQSRMSFAQADTLQYYLDGQKNIVSAKIQERTLDVTVVYTGGGIEDTGEFYVSGYGSAGELSC